MHELWSIPTSPWSLRARMALDAQGVTYRKRLYLPTLSEPILRVRTGRLAGRITAPIFLPEKGPALHDSLDIARWAAERTAAPLVTEALQADIERWNRIAEQALNAGRVRTTRRVLDDPDAIDEQIPPFLRPVETIGRAMVRRVAHGLLSKYGGDRGEDEAWEHQLVEGLEALRAGVRGRRWLLGSFTYADIAASVALEFVQPRESLPLGPANRPLWSEPHLAERYGDLLAWRARVIGEVDRRRGVAGDRGSSGSEPATTA